MASVVQAQKKNAPATISTPPQLLPTQPTITKTLPAAQTFVQKAIERRPAITNAFVQAAGKITNPTQAQNQIQQAMQPMVTKQSTAFSNAIRPIATNQSQGVAQTQNARPQMPITQPQNKSKFLNPSLGKTGFTQQAATNIPQTHSDAGIQTHFKKNLGVTTSINDPLGEKPEILKNAQDFGNTVGQTEKNPTEVKVGEIGLSTPAAPYTPKFGANNEKGIRNVGAALEAPIEQTEAKGDIGKVAGGPFTPEDAATKVKELQDKINVLAETNPDYQGVTVTTQVNKKGGVNVIIGKKEIVGTPLLIPPGGETGDDSTTAGSNLTSQENTFLSDILAFNEEKIKKAAEQDFANALLANQRNEGLIAGIGETNPAQEAEIQQGRQAFLDKAMIDLDRTKAFDTRKTTADLRNRGFASSSLAGLSLDEQVLNPYYRAQNEAELNAAMYEQELRDKLSGRKRADVESLYKIEGRFPNLPDAKQQQEGTFTKAAQIQDAIEFFKANKEFQAKDYDRKLEAIKTYFDTIGINYTPSLFGELAKGIIGAAGAVGAAKIGK